MTGKESRTGGASLKGGGHKRRGKNRKVPSGSRPLSSVVELPIIELTIGAPAHGGACIAHADDGRVVFVRHALPGEQVRAQVTAQKRTLAWADAVEIIEASPDRVDSIWPEAGPVGVNGGGVGGGELAHVTAQGQRRWKSEVLRDQLRRIGGQDVFDQCAALGQDVFEVSPTPGDAGRDDLRGWRSRVEFVINADGRPAMHEAKSSTVRPVTSLPLVMPEIVQTGVLDEDSVWPTLWKPGDRVRVVAQTGVADPKVLVAIGQDVYDSYGHRVDDVSLTHTLTVGEQDFTYRVSMHGFWQAHREGAEVLAQCVDRLAQCQEGDRVVELYAGAGLFSSVLAYRLGKSGHLVTVEGDEAAVADAAHNVAVAASNGGVWGNVDTCVGWIDEEAVLDAVGMLGSVPRVIVMDPPRDGAGREVCARVASIGAERIVLVSCDPAAGARDLKALCEGGYRVADLHAWDLYPYTHHLETVTLLTKA